jgi:hypothetical protein
MAKSIATPIEYVSARMAVMESGCWEWTASYYPNGYGCARPGGHSAPGQMAHRLVYEIEIGPIPEGLVLDHLCRNKGCCNPDHLEPVTQRENVLRGDGPSAQFAMQTHCKRGHEFTPANTYTPPSLCSRRMCRTCMRAKSAASAKRLRTLPGPDEASCRAPDCERAIKARGLCSTHYQRPAFKPYLRGEMGLDELLEHLSRPA